MIRFALAALALALVAGCGEPHDDADDGLPVRSSSRAITDGVADPGHAAVGFIRAGDGSVGCSATVVGRRSVLTAAHCVWPGQSQTVVLQGWSYEAVASTTHPDYDPDSHLGDIGLLTLGRPAHVVPQAVDTQPRGVGAAITLVGYGATAEGADDVGVRRRTTNTIASLHPSSFNIAGSGGGAGNVCHKDSGAPVLAGDKDPTGPQIGVVIGGQAPCGTLGVATRVDTYVPWLRTTAGGDLAVAGGTKTPFGLPCAAAADCASGLCVRDTASGDRFCSAACDDAAGCPEDGACVDGAGDGAARRCALPPPPVPDEGCAMAPGAGARGRRGGTASPLLLLLLLLLPLLPLRSGTPRRP